MSLLYEPPPGYYDIPFTWVYDGSGLTDGSNALNQVVPIYAGYGDFVMRRIGGLNNVLKSGFGGVTPGSYQIRDALGRYLQARPQSIGRYVGNLAYSDLAMAPEVFYKQNSSIIFDLYNVFRHSNLGNTRFGAQIAFQGVRRVPGNSSWPSSSPYKPRTYVYTKTQVLPISGGATLAAPISIYTKISNWDFELYAIRMIYAQNAFFNTAFAAPNANLSFYSQLSSTNGNGTQVILATTAVPNQPLTLSLSPGNVLTLTGATDSGGNTITNGFQIQAAINQDPAASQVFNVTNVTNGSGGYVAGTYTLAGGTAASFIGPDAITLCQLFDQNGVYCQSQPIGDPLINDIGDPYRNGALVPPLLYRQDSQIRFDVIPLANAPITMIIQFVGQQRIPC